MLPRSHPHPHQPTRRRSAVGPPQLCAIAAVFLLLLSLSVLHSRLSSSTLSPPSLPSSQSHPHSDSDSDSTPLLQSQSHLSASTTPNLSLDLIDDLDLLESDPDSTPSSKSKAALVWDHILGVARLPFGSRTPNSYSDSDSNTDSLSDFDLFSSNSDADSSSHRLRIVFSSDDYPIDEDIHAKLSSITKIEDALLIKPNKGESPLREGWAKWLEGKGDFLRKNRMLQSNLDSLNPKNHPLLQDPDAAGLTGLTRGDRLVQRVLLREMESAPFVGSREKAVERRELHQEEKQKKTEKGEERKAVKRNDGMRWGHFPGIDPYLSFTEFMHKFFGEKNKCEMRVLMVWNSPQWTYGVRHQRGLESLLKHHSHACVVVFSETMELDFFKDFVKDG